MKALFLSLTIALALPAFAQQPVKRTDTQSVVILPESQRPQIDSATLKPGKVKRHRRFEVKIVPAPPPGRSRQEILYSDSLGR